MTRDKKSSDFYEILYTADFELDERHVIKNEKVALDRQRVRQNVFLVLQVLRPTSFAHPLRGSDFTVFKRLTLVKEAHIEIGCVVTSLVGCHARALWPNGAS